MLVGPKQANKFNRRLRYWYRNNKRDYPWRRKTDLYSLLVAEILLQKTNADKVAASYKVLMANFPTPQDLMEAPNAILREIIQPLGLIGKTEILKSMASALVSLNTIEPTLEQLLAIKGIGPYIARAVLIHCYKARYPLLDPNFIRVFQRIFNLSSDSSRPRTDKRLWEEAARIMPKWDSSEYVYAMLDFGALVCRASNPRCSECPMARDVCLSAGIMTPIYPQK